MRPGRSRSKPVPMSVESHLWRMANEPLYPIAVVWNREAEWMSFQDKLTVIARLNALADTLGWSDELLAQHERNAAPVRRRWAKIKRLWMKQQIMNAENLAGKNRKSDILQKQVGGKEVARRTR